MPNPIVHFEILGTDFEALTRFYADAFGWSIDADNPMSYGLVDNGGAGINGGIGQAEQPLATFYIEVVDPAACLKRIESLGGRVVVGVTEIPGVVTFARFEDPAGNVIGLVKTGESP